MTQKEQNIIIGMIGDLTAWEAKAREWRGELTAILQKEGSPRRKPVKRPTLVEDMLKRHARKMARERKQFSLDAAKRREI